jgi:hypothetical protein
MDAQVDTVKKPSAPRRKHRASRAIRHRLLTRKTLDGRTRSRKVFDAIVAGIASDLGVDQLTTIERNLVEAFAGAACLVHDINAHLIRGDKVDSLKFSQAVSMLVRTGAKLGVSRRYLRDITPHAPTIDDIAREIAAKRAAAAAADDVDVIDAEDTG